MAEENGYNQYDPNGTSIEELMARLVQLQSRISSTISEVRREDGKLSEKQSQISQDVDSISLSVLNLQTTTEGNTADISSLVLRADSIESNVTSIDSRLGTAESSISQNAFAITQRVALSDYNGNSVMSMINQTATTITLDASKINLTGITNVASTLTLGNGTGTTAAIIFNKTDSSIGASFTGLEISSAGNLKLSPLNVTFASTTTVDFSGAKSITWGSNAPPAPPPPTSVSYATNAGNADTVDGYHASSFSMSGHDHGSAYIRPYTGQNLYLWRSGSEVRVYDGSGSYTKLTGTAF